MLTKLAKFTSAGAVGTAAHYAVLMVAVSGFSIAASFAAMMGATVGAAVNYWLSYTFVFKSTQRHLATLPRFLLMATVGMGLNGLLVSLFVAANLHYLVAQIFTTGIVLCLNFGVSNLWIFRQKPAPQDSQPTHRKS